MLNTFQTLFHFLLAKILIGRYYYYLYFTGEKTELESA